MVTLKVRTRTAKEKTHKLKQEGNIPAVFYGKKEKSTPISVKLVDFVKVWNEAGESTVITLEGDMGSKDALVYDVDLDPLTDIPRHADFYIFEEGHMLEVSVPLSFIGVSPAVKDMGGTLVKVMYELNIKAMPKNLPHEIEVDIGGLINFESQILAKDIKLPEGVNLEDNPEDVVALVEEIKEEVIEETVAPDLSTIEVEKKGKKDVEETTEESTPDKAPTQDKK